MRPERVRILSWNLAGRVKKARSQFRTLCKLEPHVIALQEITSGSWACLKPLLDHGGWHYVETVQRISQPPQGQRRGPRRYGVVIASRFPVEEVQRGARGSWPERILVADVRLRWSSLRVVTAHVPPGSSNGWVKVDVLEDLARELRSHRKRPTVFVGDLNAPQAEVRGTDGSLEVITWAQSRRAGAEARRFRPGRDERWDSAERKLTGTPAELGFRDVYRERHPKLGANGFSWCTRDRAGKLVKRRFDHVLASGALRTVACRYVSAVRRTLSDHCAVVAEFELARGAAGRLECAAPA